jgi:DsbC/DsbD-like thiol-disulfide interchange protein
MSVRLTMIALWAIGCTASAPAGSEPAAKPVVKPVAQPSIAPDKPERQLVSMATRWAAIDPGERAQIVVELEPIKGWHIYWHNPGDSGLPTSFEVTQNGQPIGHRVRMPSPKRKVSAGSIVSYGFEGSTLFFVEPTAPQTEQDLELEAVWLACAETCVKGSKKVRIAALAKSQSAPEAGDLRAWNQLPGLRPTRWSQTSKGLVFEAPAGSTVTLYPHTELHRRLDGHALSYCIKNRCELPLKVLVDNTPDQKLWATLSVSTAGRLETFETDLLKGMSP